MDIDGTLLSCSEVELDNVKHQLSRLKQHGVRFSIATGRTLFGARSVVRKLSGKNPDPLIIAYNGGVIAFTDATPWITRHTIDKNTYVNLIRACREFKAVPLVYCCKYESGKKEASEIVFTDDLVTAGNGKEFNGMPVNLIKSLDDIPTADAVAVLVTDSRGSAFVNQLALRVKQEFGASLRVTTSGGRYLEIAHPEATKRNAMEQLCVRYGIKVNAVMAIGDNFNDLEMLAAAGYGVAVANSPNEVKAVCRYVCRQEAARGVVESLIPVATAFNHSAVRQRSEKTRIKG
jgi:hypothetical protein